MRWLFLSAILAALSGCPGSEPPPQCFTVDTSCAPLYQPTSFNKVFTETIVADCGSSKGSCHSASGDSGLSFATEQEAYDGLIANHVTPGDPSCSELVVRTSSTGKDYTMPQGSALVASERCSLVKWVELGAPR
jgi:hypothetical protein